MLNAWEKVIFIFLFLGSLGAARVTFKRMANWIGTGEGKLNWSLARRNWRRALAAFFGQTTVLKNRPVVSFFHVLVAWGFILYLLVNPLDVIEGFRNHPLVLITPTIHNLYLLFVDLFSVLVLVGMIYLMFRRFVWRDSNLSIRDNVLLESDARLHISRDSAIVGIFILLHVGFRWVGNSFHLAQAGFQTFQPTASLLGALWTGMSPSALNFWAHFCWWGALGLILAFIPYFPYSKHAHLFMGPINHLLVERETSPSALEVLDLEDESIEQFGASQIQHLPAKALLDGYACIMCNRCQEACPAYVTGKELSPSAIEINKRLFMNENAPETVQDSPRLVEWLLSPEAVWACTTCGWCVEACPVANEPMVDILHVRRDLVLMESDFPAEVVTTFKNLEVNGNPWGLSGQDREKWMEGLEVPQLREKGQAEYLYWVGCAGAYDARGREVSRAMVQLLNQAGVDYAVLGNEETCTGDAARRIGNEYLFAMLAEQNIETFKQYGVKKVITQCPHCFTTLKNDYRKLGLELEVIHHTDFLARLVDEGKLQPREKVAAKVAYHDSCYLGRHNQIYDQPRQVLQSVPGTTLVELARNRERGFCCGAGGGRMWMEEKAGFKKINLERVVDVKAAAPNYLVTACPFCATMLSDGITAEGLAEKVATEDVAQFLLRSIQREADEDPASIGQTEA